MLHNLDLTDIEVDSGQNGFMNLARVDNLYIASELNDAKAIEWLKKNNVQTYIDLKSADETSYVDQEFIDGDVQYYNFPFPGIQNADHDYLDEINKVLEQTNGNVCVYCKSGNRVISWLVLHLVCLQGHNKRNILEWSGNFPFFRADAYEQIKMRFGI